MWHMSRLLLSSLLPRLLCLNLIKNHSINNQLLQHNTWLKGEETAFSKACLNYPLCKRLFPDLIKVGKEAILIKRANTLPDDLVKSLTLMMLPLLENYDVKRLEAV